VAGQFGGWTPIGAVQTANGYDVVWKVTGADQYTVWSTDSNGNYLTNVTGYAVSGTDYSLQSLETTFHQDLNGDGVIGLVATVIQVDGSTSLTEVANRFYLYNTSGTGPTLKYAGADFVTGQFGGWTPIGAVQTANGYDVAWKVTGADAYTVWSTDSNGNCSARNRLFAEDA
jgi:serralysin